MRVASTVQSVQCCPIVSKVLLDSASPYHTKAEAVVSSLAALFACNAVFLYCLLFYFFYDDPKKYCQNGHYSSSPCYIRARGVHSTVQNGLFQTGQLDTWTGQYPKKPKKKPALLRASSKGVQSVQNEWSLTHFLLSVR